MKAPSSAGSRYRLTGMVIAVMALFTAGATEAEAHSLASRHPGSPTAAFTSQVEELEVPVDGSTVSSQWVLAVGQLYRIEISGTFYVGGPGDHLGDAEFADFTRSFPQNWCFYDPRDVDIGVSIDDPVVDNAKYPFWGLPNDSHTYSVLFIGRGAPVSFTYHDCEYSDNEGSLTVLISQK